MCHTILRTWTAQAAVFTTQKHLRNVHACNNIRGRIHASELPWAQGLSFFPSSSQLLNSIIHSYISAKEVTNQTLKGCHILFSKIVKAFATGSASNACEQSSAHISFQAL